MTRLKPAYVCALAIVLAGGIFWTLGGPGFLRVITLNVKYSLLRELGRYPEHQLRYLQEYMEAATRHLGANNYYTLTAFSFLGNYYLRNGKPAEALAEFEERLKRITAAYGDDSPKTTGALIDIAIVQWQLGRFTNAEETLLRALAIPGISHDQIGRIKQWLTTMQSQRMHVAGDGAPSAYRTNDEIALAKRATDLERVIGLEEKTNSAHSEVLLARRGLLALIYANLGRMPEAEAQINLVLKLLESGVGQESYGLLEALQTQAAIYRRQGKHEQAIATLRRVLDRKLQQFGPDAWELADTYWSYGSILSDAKSWPQAYEMLQRAASIVKGRFADMRGGTYWVRAAFEEIIKVSDELRNERGDSDGRLAAAMFENAQWATRSATADAVAQMTARAASGSEPLHALVLEYQSIVAEIHAKDKLITEIAFSAADRGKLSIEQSARRKLNDRRAQLSARLANEFPKYADLVNPRPLTPADVQKYLSDQEALLLFHVSRFGNFVWAVTKDADRWAKIPISEDELNKFVRELRGALEIDQQTGLVNTNFNVETAHALYEAVIGPVSEIIAGKRHIVVVASGALTSLPLHVLITERPSRPVTAIADYRGLPWFMKKHAVTVLPSVASLKSLRGDAVRTVAPEIYIGFGNPNFTRRAQPMVVADASSSRGTAKSRLTIRSAFAGSRANLDLLDGVFQPLPETEEELRNVARVLRVPESQVRVKNEATEAAVKTLPLDRYRILHFATHALTAEDLGKKDEIDGPIVSQEKAEPALVLTLPETATELDDGLLTSSEVAALKLNADWVILSACNTASGDKPGAEAFSGLTRAFFYAGAKTLLVSHWPVASFAGVRLTTRTIETLGEQKNFIPAEALQDAMRELMNDDSHPLNAYPAVWAPFVVVGTIRRAGN